MLKCSKYHADRAEGMGLDGAWVPLILPLLAQSLGLVAHTVTLTSFSTYGGAYVQHLLGLPSLDSAGFYTGWLFSAFTIGNILSSYGWGQFADRFGRKPVVIICVCFLCVSSVALGLSTSYASAVAIMFALGVGDCLVPIMRIMIAEILGPAKVVIGMTLLPGCRSIGTIIGPVIGGFLAQPAVSHPSSFSPTGIFARYPFLLPNLAVAMLAFLSLPLIIIGVKETLKKHKRSSHKLLSSSVGVKDSPENRIDGVSLNTEDIPRQLEMTSRRSLDPKATYTSADWIPSLADGIPRIRKSSIDDGPDLEEEKTSFLERATLRDGACCYDEQEELPSLQNCDAQPSISWFGSNGLMASCRVRSLFCLELLVLAMHVGFHQMYPLWLLASVENGGLEWDLPKVGMVLGWSGVGGMLFQFIVYPVLCRTVGIVKLLRIFGAAAVLIFLVIPDVQRLSWSKQHPYLVGVILLVLVECFTSVYDIATTIAVANAVPAHLRGQLSALVAVGGSLGRIVGPAGLSSLLAWSLHCSSAKYGGLVDYHLVFVIESIIMVIIVLIGFRMFTLASLTIPVD